MLCRERCVVVIKLVIGELLFLSYPQEFLAVHHFMRVSDYADITGLSYSSAQRELRELDKYEYTGIKAQGLASHRVYVLSEPKS